MDTAENKVIPPEVLDNLQAVAECAANGKAIPPDLAQRIADRSQKTKEDMNRRFGEREIAVDLIREARDQS